jgi:hypothetical protein
MKTGHIPEPWYVAFGADDAVIHNGVTNASVNDGAIAWKTNDRLIAAAPELLAALGGVMEWWMESADGDEMPTDLFDRAHAALAKARGGAR